MVSTKILVLFGLVLCLLLVEAKPAPASEDGSAKTNVTKEPTLASVVSHNNAPHVTVASEVSEVATSTHVNGSKTEACTGFCDYLKPICDSLDKISADQMIKIQTQFKQFVQKTNGKMSLCFVDHYQLDPTFKPVGHDDLNTICASRKKVDSSKGSFKSFQTCAANHWDPELDKELAAIKAARAADSTNNQHSESKAADENIELSMINAVVNKVLGQGGSLDEKNSDVKVIDVSGDVAGKVAPTVASVAHNQTSTTVSPKELLKDPNNTVIVIVDDTTTTVQPTAANSTSTHAKTTVSPSSSTKPPTIIIITTTALPTTTTVKPIETPEQILQKHEKQDVSPHTAAADAKIHHQQQQQQHHQVVGNSGKLSSSSSSPPSVDAIPSLITPAVNNHDQIISASPLSSSSQQQQHHEFLSTNSNQQHLGQVESLASMASTSATGQVTANSNQQQETTHLTTIQHNQQQSQQIATSSNVVAGSEHTVIKDQAHSPVLVPGGQEQHLTTGNSQTSTISAVQDHVAAAAAPALVHSAVQQQEFVTGATVASGTQTHQEAIGSTTSNTIVQQQSSIHEQPASHLGNDLITLAKLQAAEQAATTTTSSSSHQEAVQLGSTVGPPTPPTISPVANLLLNSIDFATKAPLATVAPVAVIPVPVSSAAVPIQPNVVGQVLPVGDVSASNYGQHQQSTTVATNSMTTSSIANSHDAIAAPAQLAANQVVPIDATSAASSQHTATTTTTNTGANLALVPAAAAAAPVVLHQQHQPEVLAAPSTIPAIVPALAVPASVAAATSSGHTETVSQASQVLDSHQQQHHLVPPPTQIQQAVAVAPLVEPAVIKNVNSALDVMASTNSSGIVSLAPSNNTNTTLFVSNSGSNTSIKATTTTQAPITILVKTDDKATTVNQTTTTTTAPTSGPTTTSTTAKPKETKAPAGSEKKRNKKRKKKIGHHERLAKLRSKYGSARVHDVIVIGEHEDGDDVMEDYDDHSEHHEHGDDHEHSDHHDDGSLILNHSSSSSSKKHEESSKAPKASAEITTVEEDDDDSSIEEHKEHEHLLADLKSGDVVHVDAGEA